MVYSLHTVRGMSYATQQLKYTAVLRRPDGLCMLKTIITGWSY